MEFVCLRKEEKGALFERIYNSFVASGEGGLKGHSTVALLIKESWERTTKAFTCDIET
jgi:hypothetical protein